MLYISHDLSVVRYLSDYLYVMRRGEIVEHGLVDDVFGSPQQPYTQALLSAVRRFGGNRWRRRLSATSNRVVRGSAGSWSALTSVVGVVGGIASLRPRSDARMSRGGQPSE